MLSLGLLWNCSREAEEVPQITLNQDQEAFARQVIEETEQAIADARREADREAVSDRSGNTVYVAAGSSDALADAIADAGPNGTVILESGPHSESGTVMIPHRLNLIGEPGAVLTIDAGPANFTDVPVVLTAGLHVKGANNTRIEGLEIRPEGENGKVAILVEDSRRVRIANNAIFDFQFGVFTYGADNVFLFGNYLRGLQGPEYHYGMMLMKGRSVKLFENEIEQYDSAVFTSDRSGLAFENNFHNNLSWGIFHCKAPADYTLPDGPVIQASETTNNWVIARNVCNNNGFGGYAVIDGAFENRLVANRAANNGILGIVLFPEWGSQPLPPCRDNLVISTQQPNVTIMDCGIDNSVIGGIQVECFL